MVFTELEVEKKSGTNSENEVREEVSEETIEYISKFVIWWLLIGQSFRHRSIKKSYIYRRFTVARFDKLRAKEVVGYA